jgi:hypothetical protein
MQNPVAMPKGGMTIFRRVTAVRPSRTRQARTAPIPASEPTTDNGLKGTMIPRAKPGPETVKKCEKTWFYDAI